MLQASDYYYLHPDTH